MVEKLMLTIGGCYQVETENGAHRVAMFDHDRRTGCSLWIDVSEALRIDGRVWVRHCGIQAPVSSETLQAMRSYLIGNVGTLVGILNHPFKEEPKKKKAPDVREMLDEREGRYGKFPDHALISQCLKRVLLNHPKWEGLGFAQRESLEMICHKMARIMNGDPDYRDNWDDIAGYATLVSDELKRQEAGDARR